MNSTLQISTKCGQGECGSKIGNFSGRHKWMVPQAHMRTTYHTYTRTSSSFAILCSGCVVEKSGQREREREREREGDGLRELRMQYSFPPQHCLLLPTGRQTNLRYTVRARRRSFRLLSARESGSLSKRLFLFSRI